jgi:hypothetical protein
LRALFSPCVASRRPRSIRDIRSCRGPPSRSISTCLKPAKILRSLSLDGVFDMPKILPHNLWSCQNEYTQMSQDFDFAPYSPKRRTRLKQAQWLLRELVNDRHHQFPCDCGACISCAYHRSEKPKGREFSKRTLFVFFLRWDFFDIVFFDKRLRRSDSLRKIAWKQSRDFKISGRPIWSIFYFPRDLEPGEKEKTVAGSYVHAPNIYVERVKKISRRRTLDMIKRLEREERGRTREFLRGILKKKSFYTYYNRAGGPELASIINKVRRDLRSGSSQENH